VNVCIRVQQLPEEQAGQKRPGKGRKQKEKKKKNKTQTKTTGFHDEKQQTT
jgi:hypothetical protein